MEEKKSKKEKVEKIYEKQQRKKESGMLTFQQKSVSDMGANKHSLKFMMPGNMLLSKLNYNF